MTRIKTDFLIIGSGVSGLFTALKLAPLGSVVVVTKKADYESNTNYAQGGIASVFDDKDKFEEHIQDTLESGAGLCDLDAVRVLVEEGPTRVRELLDLGVPFTRNQTGELDLAREGGHSKNRIIHSLDRTGSAVEQSLLDHVHANKNIQILENHACVDLITKHHLKDKGNLPLRCYGAYIVDTETGEVFPVLAKKTILATGGAGQVYLHTTNPNIATGDGVASAYRAGAIVKNMEFYQFHPTSLFHEQGNSFLISEAVRGHGGILREIGGRPFMKDYHTLGELAPRDIVARAIDDTMKKRGEPHVLLDITHRPANDIINHFPSIYERCKKLGIDITTDPIPVVPAAHYMCGGVATDLLGRTNIADLYACGETTCTGVHGGNRLASNSLLECLVFSHRIAGDIQSQGKLSYSAETDLIPDWNKEGTTNTEEWVLISHDLIEIKTIMSNYVGIVRSDMRLERALRRIKLISEEVKDYYNRTTVSLGLLELRNLVKVAELIVRSALLRKESRGLHFSTDYPEDRTPSRQDTILSHKL
ncbi:L-aspartate oxidase [Leptospira bandrabouensis]|uniref:L-aspartate oxidase n=1 Tax=Leptospira bandrabouensis TaxID=2484903 RepID=A0A6H3NU59_9LEPT|nr:L-aspartate oxidase [Leptospira bandrabouensis]MCG6143540.1 L-aspartate oxidase [Leptospira bandrabouensis]MCG6151418.1 L-aspartate oxidase [Leptospira bandrabouensis]MCG6159200.1 L-aspartate oxidase [Leptospira bandrabouensis]MCG6163134.1 L-aspartate oxidase [Leptospira bandrabouensis]MCW7458774.1 L-aspartate oxidase [Leptospira bandrabouensis]